MDLIVTDKVLNTGPIKNLLRQGEANIDKPVIVLDKMYNNMDISGYTYTLRAASEKNTLVSRPLTKTIDAVNKKIKLTWDVVPEYTAVPGLLHITIVGTSATGEEIIKITADAINILQDPCSWSAPSPDVVTDAINQMTAILMQARGEADRAKAEADRLVDVGVRFRVIGAYDTLAELQADVTTPAVGDAYQVGTTTKTIYLWDGVSWVDMGPIKGPSSINGKYPDASGAVTIGAPDILMTGYTKPATWGDILPTDNVAQALGKVDARNLAYYGGSNPNMLINWDFRKPINQRGQMNYTLNGYTIDMWTCNGGELAIVAGGITISQNHVIFQKIERNIDTTKVYTASYLDVNGIVHSAEVSTFGSYITIDANVNVYVDSTTVYFASSNSANIIAAVKLELGTVSTIANDPPANYAEQLALCQRYYVRYAPTAVIWLSKGEAVSTTSARFILYLPQSLRVTPAIGFSNCTVGYEGATAIDITGISVLAQQSNIIAIDCTLASAVTQYRSLNLRLPVGSFIAFDANL